MPEEKKLGKRLSGGQVLTQDRHELLRRASGTAAAPVNLTFPAGVSFASPLVEEARARNLLGMAVDTPHGAGSPAERMMLATAAINPLIARAEQAIARMGFHVVAAVLLEREADGQWSKYLRFGKEGREWCLMVDSGPDDDPDRWTSARLHTTSRETRLKALELLPRLVDELSGTAERQAVAAQKIIDSAAAFIDVLERTHQ